MCQTIRAHRLSRKAFDVGGQDLQEKFLDTIFHAYFTEGKNISDFDVLADMSEQVGVMPKDKVRKPSSWGWGTRFPTCGAAGSRVPSLEGASRRNPEYGDGGTQEGRHWRAIHHHQREVGRKRRSDIRDLRSGAPLGSPPSPVC